MDTTEHTSQQSFEQLSQVDYFCNQIFFSREDPASLEMLLSKDSQLYFNLPDLELVSMSEPEEHYSTAIL